MEQTVDNLNNIPFIKPSPNILNTFWKAKKWGYKIVIYQSTKQSKNLFFRKKTPKSSSENSQFDYVMKANYAEDIILFAKENDIDLSQSIFIRTAQNELKDLDVNKFSSVKLLANA